jgi:eukaryotic-like serine/threonine-protein kinase
MTSMLRLDDRLADRFRVDAEVTAGGMGIIYRGHDHARDRAVAIKVLRDGVIESEGRFAREASALAAIEHPGIVRYVAHGVMPDGAPYLVMDWVEGPTLAERLDHPGLTPRESVAVVGTLASALGAVHRAGLVHRDLKPQNVVFAGGAVDRPVLIDFGLARSAVGHHRVTATGSVVGTPGYMAPEQARGEREVEARTDVFALGCVLYECLAGEPAFAGRNAAAIMARIVLCEPPRLREVWPEAPADLERLVSTMMAKLREDRPADGDAVAAALRGIAMPAAGGRRPRKGGSEASTVVGERRARHVAFVRGAITTSELAAIAAPHAARVEALADDTHVVVLDRSTEATAEYALAVRAAHPQVTIAIAGPDAGESAPLAALLDAGGAALEEADLADIFAGADVGAIRVDAGTAARLAGRFAIRRDKAGCYLDGEAPAERAR